MYRDDVCAVCGESLPPDHFYCAEHAAGVDARLHELGAVLGRWLGDLERAAALLDQVAPETWDYLAEQEPDDPPWPLAPVIELAADPDDVAVGVDSEPGLVRIRLSVELPILLKALTTGPEALQRLAKACADAHGANATH